MADDPFSDDFFKNKFDSEFHSRSFDDSFRKHNEEFDKSFAAAEKVFFIFFGLVVTFIVGGFVLAIFLICVRICKGESYRSYRRNRRGQTIIPPPPPGSCKHSFILYYLIYIFADLLIRFYFMLLPMNSLCIIRNQRPNLISKLFQLIVCKSSKSKYTEYIRDVLCPALYYYA